jgi:hypothetical protein
LEGSLSVNFAARFCLACVIFGSGCMFRVCTSCSASRRIWRIPSLI